MGDNLGVKVSCGRWPDEPLAEGNCEGANLGGEEAGEQNLDWMNKNCVARHRVRDELARDSEVQKGSKQPYVNAARVRGRLSNLIRGGLPFLWAEVSRGRSSRWSNDHPGRLGKPNYRAKGRTVEELSRKEKGSGEGSRNLARPGQTWK